MKKILLLTLVSACFQFVYAQNTQKMIEHFLQESNQNAHSFNLEKMQPKKVRANERLVSKNFHYHNGSNYEIGDSSQFIYNGGFGYDETPLLFYNYVLGAISYDYYDNKVNYYDKLYRKLNTGGTTFSLLDSTINTFGAGHKLLHQKIGKSPQDSSVYEFFYDNNDRKILMKDSIKYGSIGFTRDSVIYYYAQTSKVQEVRYYTGTNLMWYFIYTYDASDRLIKAKLYDPNIVNPLISETNYFYDINNNVIQQDFESWTPAPGSYSRTEFSYDASNRLTLKYTKDSTSSGTWFPVSKILFSYSSGNYPDSIINYNYDINTSSFILEDMHTYTYTSNGKISKDETFYYNSATSNYYPSRKNLYYYENYVPNGVQEIQGELFELNIYPNPVSVNLRIEGEMNNNIARIQIRNMIGNLVYEKKIEPQGYLKEDIDFSNIANGIYILEISSQNGKITKVIQK